MKPFKKILAIFLAISVTMITTPGICDTSDDILIFVSAFTRPRMYIQNLSTKTSAPFNIIKINGRKFSPISDLLVVFSNGPYVVKVPPIYGTANTLEVPVPFYFNTTTGAPGPGVVSITVTSKSKDIRSNSISGFTITGFPVSIDTPGTVTLNFLRDMKTLVGIAQTQLTFLQEASNGNVNTTAQIASLTSKLSTLNELDSAVVAIMNGQPLSGNSTIKVTLQSLSIADQLFLGVLTQLNAIATAPLSASASFGPGEDSDRLTAAAIPSLKQIYDTLQSHAKNINFDEQKLLEYMKRYEAVVGTTAAALTLGATFLGFPAVAMAVGGFAMVYSMAICFSDIQDYVCCYLGLPSGVTKAQGFLPLANTLFDTGLAMAVFRLPDTSLPKQLADLYGQTSYDTNLAKRLVEPVINNASIIYPKLNVSITLSPATINTEIGCITNPPSGTGTFTLWEGTVAVNVQENLGWSVTIPSLPEPGSAVTINPTNGSGPTSVSVVITYPGKSCWCPCSLHWAGGPIAEFRTILNSAVLSVTVDDSSCVCQSNQSVSAVPDFYLGK